MSDLCRRALDALLPPGSLWGPADGGGLDKLLDGIAGALEPVFAVVDSLAYVRDPLFTSVLDDLEREFGVVPDTRLAESIRRARLARVKGNRSSNGSAYTLEKQLQAAGFDLYVHVNDPPVNPATVVPTASELVVNGDTYQHSYFSATTSGDMGAITGMAGAVCGIPAGFAQVKIPYAYPSANWPLVFFVGGPATRNGGGEITAIEPAWTSPARRSELISIICRYKPLHSWAAVCTDGGVLGVVLEDTGGSGARAMLQARQANTGEWQLELVNTTEALGDELYIVDDWGSGKVVHVTAQVIGVDDQMQPVWSPVLTTAAVPAPAFVGLQDAGGGYGVTRLKALYLGLDENNDDIWQLSI